MATALEIRFPRVEATSSQLLKERLEAKFPNGGLAARPQRTPNFWSSVDQRTEGRSSAKASEPNTRTLETPAKSTVLFPRNQAMLLHQIPRTPRMNSTTSVRPVLKEHGRQWMDSYLECKGNTYRPAFVINELPTWVRNESRQGISRSLHRRKTHQAMLERLQPTAAALRFSFNTKQTDSAGKRLATNPTCNWVVATAIGKAIPAAFLGNRTTRCILCEESGPLVFEVPYKMGKRSRKYIPDFMFRVDDDHGPTTC